MKFFVKDNGKIYGPIEAPKIVDAISDGFFSPDCMLSPDRSDWLLFRHVMPNAVIRPSSSPGYTKPVPEKPNAVNTTGYSIPSANTGSNVPPSPILPPARSGSGKTIFAVIMTVVVVLLACACGYYFFFRQPEVTDFRQTCQQYQSAVGLVTVVLEDSDGKLLSGNVGKLILKAEHPIGTAFAISSNRFVTNCHVAYGVKERKDALIDNWLWSLVLEAAKRDGVKTTGEFNSYVQKNKTAIKKVAEQLKKKVRVRRVEIRLAHSSGKALRISGVQIHPRYNPKPDNEYRNGEFDVAILHTREKVDIFFPIAEKKLLHSLAAGQKIAYMGFPMEGLDDSGNLDISNPEAIFKEGSINKITDFHNIFSTPENNRSIIHDIPAAGGASGSPIFLPNGKVVAVLWGVTHTGRNNQGARVASAVQHNMAVRIDSLDAVHQESIYHLNDWTGDND